MQDAYKYYEKPDGKSRGPTPAARRRMPAPPIDASDVLRFDDDLAAVDPDEFADRRYARHWLTIKAHLRTLYFYCLEHTPIHRRSTVLKTYLLSVTPLCPAHPYPLSFPVSYTYSPTLTPPASCPDSPKLTGRSMPQHVCSRSTVSYTHIYTIIHCLINSFTYPHTPASCTDSPKRTGRSMPRHVCSRPTV